MFAVAVYPVVPSPDGSFFRSHFIEGFRWWSLRVVILVAGIANDVCLDFSVTYLGKIGAELGSAANRAGLTSNHVIPSAS
ncbi:hypothetical protein DC522_01380 [Microvirga sp. KLBC 81]|nr:hypothetical protein DC522_01380 [Microvirga sp. KLBC 81]